MKMTQMKLQLLKINYNYVEMVIILGITIYYLNK